VFDRIGISVTRAQGGACCGALSHHLSADEEARAIVRRNIDTWWPQVEEGVEAIVVTASGCGVMVKDYGHFLQHDPTYAAKAQRIAELARDPIEIVTAEWRKIAPLVAMDQGPQRIAFHPPCTLRMACRSTARSKRSVSTRTLAPASRRCAYLLRISGAYSIPQPVTGELKAISCGRSKHRGRT
jgi:glycolate oxidase iron-sulfur subunit